MVKVSDTAWFYCGGEWQRKWVETFSLKKILFWWQMVGCQIPEGENCRSSNSLCALNHRPLARQAWPSNQLITLSYISVRVRGGKFEMKKEKRKNHNRQHSTFNTRSWLLWTVTHSIPAGSISQIKNDKPWALGAVWAPVPVWMMR